MKITMRTSNHFNLLLTALLSLFLVQACDYLPSSSPPLTFDNDILRFDYPENWNVDSGGATGGLQYVSIGGPSSTEVIFQIYPKQGAPTLQEFADWFSREFMQLISFGEIRKISFSETTSKIGDLEMTGIREEFMLTVFGFEVPHSREYFAHSGDDLLIFLVFQISDDGASLWGENLAAIRESLVFK